MRQVLNKSASNQTVSQLYQSNWSGRAETGLTGDDNFHVKVSPDGNAWHDAILIDRTTGRVSFPAAPRREVLSANRTYFVSTSGNDNNSGLSAGTPFATIAKAWQVLLQLDLNGFSVTKSLAPGVYAPFTATGALVGQSSVTSVQIQGAGASTEIAAPGAASAIITQNGAQVTVRDLKVSSATGNGLWAQTGGRINIHGGLDFGQANAHMRADLGGLITNTYASPTRFQDRRTIMSGATGRRYQALFGGLINTFGGGANYFPGDVAGTTGTGGQYA